MWNVAVVGAAAVVGVAAVVIGVAVVVGAAVVVWAVAPVEGGLGRPVAKGNCVDVAGTVA